MSYVSEFPSVQEIRLSICDAADFREAAELVQTAALQLPGVDAVGIYAFDCRGDFHLVSHAGVSAAYAALFREFPADSLQARLVMQGEPIYRKVPDLPPDRAALYEPEGLKAIAVYPIKHKEHVVGSLHIGTRQLPEIPLELCAQLEVFVQSLANTIARITYEAMARRAYEEVEAKVKNRTLELQGANDALRASEEKFRLLAERSQVMIAITRNDRFVYVNPSVIALSGYTRDELLAMDALRLIPPEFRAIAADRARRRLAGERLPDFYEYPMLTKTGETRWIEVSPVRIEYLGAPALAGVATDITARKQAEQAHRESEERFAAFMRYLPGPAWIKDLAGRYVYINAEAGRAFGVQAEDILGKTDYEVFPPETAKQFRENDGRVLAEGDCVQTLEVLRQSDGRDHHSIVSKFALRDAAGHPAYIAGVALDITERRLAEERLKDHAWRLEVLSEITGSLLRNGNAAETMQSVFASISEHLGLDVYLHYRLDEDQCGLTLHAYGGLTAKQVAPVRQLRFDSEVCSTVAQRHTRVYISHVQSSPEPHANLLRQLDLQAYVCHPLLAHDRLVGTLSFGSRKSAEFDEGTLALLQTISDQTAIAIARHDAEKAVQEREARFRQLADAMPQLVWTAQPDGTIDYCNQRAEDYSSLQCNVDHSWDASALVHPDDLNVTLDAWRRTVQSGAPFQIEYRLRLRSGLYRWHLCRAKPYRDESGRIVKWYATSTDIDDLRRVQLALEEAQHRKDDFIAMLGHELRNPLAPLRNVVHVLKRTGPADPFVQRSHDMIERQVSHMARLIDDLLDVSRISHGKIQLRKTRVDLTRVVQTCGEDFHPLMEASSLRFHLQTPETPLWIYGDAARLEQIVSNLLSNAMKFTDPGGVVALSLTAQPTQAEIAVQDTGIGIEPEVLRRVFDPFSQASKAADRGRGGLGLGLALVKGLVELHGGQVQAESPGVGRGSVFRVRLPIATAVTPGPVGTVPRQLGKAAPRRVLIVEDNLDAADSLQMLLAMLGHEVAVAHSGPEGLEKAYEFKPQVVLCDIGLPGSMDGYALARALRGAPQFSAAYLVAMTGFGQEEDRRRALEAGFDQHLTKPADPEVLEQLLSR